MTRWDDGGMDEWERAAPCCAFINHPLIHSSSAADSLASSHHWCLLFGWYLGRGLLVPFGHFGNDIIYFLRREFREHRQANTGRGVMFRMADRAGNACPFAPGITCLLVNGDRVMGLGVDAIFHQVI